MLAPNNSELARSPFFNDPDVEARFAEIINSESRIFHFLPEGNDLDYRFDKFAEQIDGLVLPVDLKDAITYSGEIEDSTTVYAKAARSNVLFNGGDPLLTAFVNKWEFEEVQLHGRVNAVILRAASFTGPRLTREAVYPSSPEHKRAQFIGDIVGKAYIWVQDLLSSRSRTVASSGVGITGFFGLLNEGQAHEFYMGVNRIIGKVETPQQKAAKRMIGAMAGDEANSHGKGYFLMAERALTHEDPGVRFVTREVIEQASRRLTPVGVGRMTLAQFDEVSYVANVGEPEVCEGVTERINERMSGLSFVGHLRPAVRMVQESFNRAHARRPHAVTFAQAS